MKKHSIAHLISGIVVILHGIADLEVHHGKPLFYFLMGILMIFVGVKNDAVAKFSKTLANSFYFIEAIVIFFIAFHFFELGKKFIPWIYTISGVLYFYVGIKNLKKKTTK
jgi:hypothetical protein